MFKVCLILDFLADCPCHSTVMAGWKNAGGVTGEGAHTCSQGTDNLSIALPQCSRNAHNEHSCSAAHTTAAAGAIALCRPLPACQVEEEEYQLKPMNCPFHVAMYKHGYYSYRELPKRWAELGTVYRCAPLLTRQGQRPRLQCHRHCTKCGCPLEGSAVAVQMACNARRVGNRQ